MKIRADELLVKQGLAQTRSQAKLLIKEGKVANISKPSQLVKEEERLSISPGEIYVSRGAYKLKAAIEKFEINPTGKTVADIGASTGGFTDFLLQNGATKIYAIDVGTSQLATKLQTDPRVNNIESTNIRDLTELPEKVDLAVTDLSYISLRLALPNIAKLINPNAPIIALLKPQFEAGKDRVPKDGVIKDPETLTEVIEEFRTWCANNNFIIEKLIPSPITGKKGNKEFLALIFSTGLANS